MDNLILDTHVFIWYAIGDKQISQKALKYIDSSTEKWISTASIWEMAIKISLGKLVFKQPFSKLIDKQIQLNKYKLMANSQRAHLSTG